METLSYSQVQCPYCGETIELQLDCSCGEQAYIEDCSVCCRPIEVHLYAVDGDLTAEVRRDDE